MRAMEKDRRHRYSSAAEFAGDVERYLNNEPVFASPPSRLYRVRKFVSKNRWAVTAAAIMFVTIAGQIYSDTRQLETTLVMALITVLIILLLANLYFWGTPLPSTGNESLPLHLLGEELPGLVERPRLLLAYAHPLLAGDFLALSVVCLYTARLNKALKVVGIPILLGLGISELSMSSPSIPGTKEIIRSWTVADAEKLASAALESDSAESVRKLVKSTAPLNTNILD